MRIYERVFDELRVQLIVKVHLWLYRNVVKWTKPVRNVKREAARRVKEVVIGWRHAAAVKTEDN